jgi:hypothetical protein
MTRNYQSLKTRIPSRRLNIDGMSTVSSLLRGRRKSDGNERIASRRTVNTSS